MTAVDSGTALTLSAGRTSCSSHQGRGAVRRAANLPLRRGTRSAMRDGQRSHQEVADDAPPHPGTGGARKSLLPIPAPAAIVTAGSRIRQHRKCGPLRRQGEAQAHLVVAVLLMGQTTTYLPSSSCGGGKGSESSQSAGSFLARPAAEERSKWGYEIENPRLR